MKAIVVSVDKTMRINVPTSECIEAFRPSVVTITEFTSTLVMQGKLKPLAGELPDSATDAEFSKFLKECKDKDGKQDVELAVQSYVEKLKVNAQEKLSVDDAAAKAAEEKAAAEKAAAEKAAAEKAAAEKAAKAAAEKNGAK